MITDSSTYVADRIKSLLAPIIDKGANFGIYDSESRYSLLYIIDRFVEKGEIKVIDQESLQLYDTPGVEAYVFDLNTQFRAVCEKINEVLRNE